MRTPPSRALLMQGASVLCLALFGATMAHAQLAGLNNSLRVPNLPANAIPAPGAVPTPNLGSASIVRDPGSAVARQFATQLRLANTVNLVTQAQTAARDAARTPAALLAQTVPNGLAPGGLALAANPVPAAQDPSGLHTLQGALAPIKAVQADGATTVTVKQTDSRAIISWDTLNVGLQTTLVFDQKVNGVAQKDWVAFNRVVGQLTAGGGRNADLAPAPSQILGRIEADATVIVINANGVFFGPGSQVRAGSLLVSTIDFGSNFVQASGIRRPSTVADRNSAFLVGGLFQTGISANFNPAGVANALGGVSPETQVEGDIRVSVGADLAAADAGTLLLAAPRIDNAGTLAASNGSVLLAAGRQVRLDTSSGATGTGGDPDIRGIFIGFAFLPTGAAPSDSYIRNTGIVTSPRGYIGFRSDNGAILQEGVLTSTTSVSRNGFIDLNAPDLQLGTGSTLAITPDTGGETIPQSPDSVVAFKTSRVRLTNPGAVSRVEIAANALVYAPGSRVEVGSAQTGSRVFVDSGATIDVGGVKDVLVPASRNQITISPAKRNELRDTPNYREAFLNGATVYLDPRRSGVRADGVRWVGSPLIEAESYFQQIGITSAELLTRGGSVSLTGTTGGDIIVKPGAAIDVSGGYVRYAAGQVQTSQLITRGGQIVDIGNADPNGDYVGLVNPFTTTNTRFGITDRFPNGTLQGVTQAAEYIEGRDAGALSLSASSIALDGIVYGQAYAGSLQRADAVRGTATPTLPGDARALQAVPSQLPSGALLAIGSGLVPGRVSGDILVTRSSAIAPVPSGLAYGQSVSIAADGSLVRPARDPASLLSDERLLTTELADTALSGMNLGQLTLNAAAQITLGVGTLTTLAPGGVFTATAGRRLLIDGTVSAPSGQIALTTYNVPVDAAISAGGLPFVEQPIGPGSFDVTVNGTLSVAGRFTNDFGLAPDLADGGGYTRGGAISIFAAPRVFTTLGAPANEAIDLSGSILLNPGSLVDVSGGAYVGPRGTIDTTARGGDLALFNETNYLQFSPAATRFGVFVFAQLRVDPGGNDAGAYQTNPRAITARVAIAPGTVRAHGFAGGGTFTLTTPSLTFGDGIAATGTELPLNFLRDTGFATANIQVLKTALFPNRIVDGLGGYNALLDTNTLTIGAGQTLDLTQSRFSPLLAADQAGALQQLASGGSLYSVLAPTVATDLFDRQPIALSLSGLIEIDVLAGGTITGAPGASLTASKIDVEGTIGLRGGSVTADNRLPQNFITVPELPYGIGVRSLSEALTTRANGDIVLTDPNAFGISINNQLASNFTVAQRPIYLLGKLDRDESLRIAAGALIDVSGISVRNPRALAPNGTPVIDGRLLAGGLVQTTPSSIRGGSLFQSRFGSPYDGANFTGEGATARLTQKLNALPGATIDISGAADSYARLDSAGLFVPTPQWSSAGTLALRGGGTVAGAAVRAQGGDIQATGGTLVVSDLVLSQTDPAVSGTGAIAADQIASSGFDTVVAEGSLDTIGPVSLSLRRAFIVRSAAYDGEPAGAESRFGVTIGATGALDIQAPIVRFASIAQTVPNIALGTPGTASARFSANALDIQGGVLFDRSLASVTLAAASDLRLIGAQPIETTLGVTGVTIAPSLIGQAITSGDLTLSAGQVYPTTGSTFIVASAAPTGKVRLTRTNAVAPPTPYSAGTNLTIQAATIEQGGVLRAPLGTLTLGSNTALVSATGQTLAPATGNLHLTAGSITSVSADGPSIPYGVTTDQVEYFFTPTTATELTGPPAAILRLGGANIALDSGATINLKGGGDVYAYEFVPGTGGSRDVLDRFNSDPFSSNNGFQYPDGRQVYAIVPSLQDAGLALVDPIYSADYSALTGANQVGRRVYLNAAPGLAAGWYTLLPARYALLPGGLRVVEQPEYGAAIPGASATLLDGTSVIGGYYGVAGTNLRESELRTFTVQTQDTFRRFSSIATTSADTVFPARAARNGLTSPRIPLDAGRLVIDAITGITANATFLTTPADGGRASTADIRGTSFQIVGSAPSTPAPAGTIVITAGTLQQLNVASLLIGATRTDNADGTTSLDITGKSILVANDGSSALTAPELLFAVDGDGSSIRFADGASVSTVGALGDPRTGDYLIAGNATGQTGAGAFVRLSTGPERLVTRSNVQPVATAPLLDVGLAHLAATSLLLDSSGDLRIASPLAGSADIAASALAIGAGAVAFTPDPVASGLRITPQIQAALGRANTLTIRSRDGVTFAPGTYGFGALALDTPVLGLIDNGGAVVLNTGALALSNDAAQALTCALACGTGTLTVNASSIAFGSGQLRLAGFGGGVALAAPGGTTFSGGDNTNTAANNGAAGLDAGSAPLLLATPFLGDRALPLKPGQSALLPRLALATTGTLTLTGGGTAPTVAGTPGARLSLSGSDVSITDTQVVATAGVLDVNATGGIVLAGTGSLATPGYAKVFGDASDPVTQSAPGGVLRLTAGNGGIALGEATTLSVGGGVGRSGELRLTAASGTVSALGKIDAQTTEGSGGFALRTRGAFDLAGFATNSASGFDRFVDIRTGAGDLALASGQTLTSRDVALTADGGAVMVAGTIDASGVTGGDIALYGANGVTLASTGRLAARASGYAANDSRQASGGNIALGTDGTGKIALAAGSVVDVSATRLGDRLVADVRAGQTYYRLAGGDRGGTLAIRAPFDEAASSVPVTAAGTVTGAREVSVEGFKRFDLEMLAKPASGFTGVTLDNGVAVIDVGAAGNNAMGDNNVFAGKGVGTIPSFVQGFNLAGSVGKLGGLGTYVARPGIELDHAGGIRLASNWNLGAGTVDVAAAVAAGDLAANPALPGQFYVVPGREADLFQRFTTLTYRVGGTAEGEPGLLTIRAGGTLDLAGSLTDGFFAFRDQTTPEALSYAFGGGARVVQPLVTPDCANGDCTSVQPFDPNGVFDFTTAITIDLSMLGAGPTLAIPPGYNAAANGAAPSGGDPLGTADLFPRLTTATGTRAAGSWSYRLVGGADLTARADAPSANPLATRTDPAAGVTVRGETSYAVNPGSGPQTFSGSLLTLAFPSSALGGQFTGFIADPANFTRTFIDNTGVDLNAATILSLAGPGGSNDPVGTFLNDRANAFFAAFPDRVQFGTDQNGNNAVTTTIDLAGQFLASIAADYAGVAAAATGYAQPSVPTGAPTFATNYVRTRVRTGTGSISVAAAGNIDTTNGAVVQRLSAANTNPAALLQVGGTAIYTAGARADLSARTVAGRSVDPAGHIDATSIFASLDPASFTPVVDALAADPLDLEGGGNVSLTAGGDVLGRRDVQGGFRLGSGRSSFVGTADQPYRLGQIDRITTIAVNPQLFQTGVATLGGGAIRVSAGRDLSDLTVVDNVSIVTADVGGGAQAATTALATVGGGDVRLSAGRDVVSGLFDTGQGTFALRAAGDMISTGQLALNANSTVRTSNAVRVRVADSTATLDVIGQATVRDINAFGVSVSGQGFLNGIGTPQLNENARNFFTPVAGFALTANGAFTLQDYGSELPGLTSAVVPQAVLPGSVSLVSLTGDLVLAPSNLFELWLSPSPIGQLSLLAGGNLRPVGVTMDDGDPGLLPGYFSTYSADVGTGLPIIGRLFAFPAVLSTTTDAERRLLHNSSPTHAGDSAPARIAVGGDIDTLRLSTPKQTRVYAGQDVLNSAVFAQNLAASEVSRVSAGRDVIATNIIGQRHEGANFVGASLPIAQGNTFVIGGPGALYVEAGRDAGPFLTSVVATAQNGAGRQTLGGGVLSVGNEWNPWLAPVGASVSVQFGTSKGVNYAGLRDAYVNPANVDALADEVFEQVTDSFGRPQADRTRPIYAPILIAWAQANAAPELIAAYGTTSVTVAQAYAVFKALPQLRQRQFLIENVYFNELRQTSIPTSVSYLKYSRGYRAVNTLFPPSSGYTANDLSGGGGTGTIPVETGNLDLRLATIQTSRGGNIDILGPGGRVLGGSTVRTSAQAARRLTIAERVYDGLPTASVLASDPLLGRGPFPTTIDSIPTGFEGVLTLRGGLVNGFVDQNFLLNQSRLFTEAGGDIALWSSNGDLNAGAGPKTSANFPPVVVRVGPNGNSEVDAVGGVTGAGIAAFQPAPDVPAPNVFLIAPRGTVDAGDAGVRVAGNLFVAALSVANADNFSVGGSAFGIPAGPVVNVAAASAAGAASAAAQQAAAAASNATNRRSIDPLSRIFVDVLGYYGGPDPCNQIPRPANCPATR